MEHFMPYVIMLIAFCILGLMVSCVI